MSAPGPVLTRQPVTDPVTGLVSREWASWLEQIRAAVAVVAAPVVALVAAIDWSGLPSGAGAWNGSPTIAGPVSAPSFAGNGAALTSLNATALTTGTVAVGRLPTAIPAPNIASGIVSNTEFEYLDGVTSGIQAQLDDRLVKPWVRKSGWVTFFPANIAPIGAGLEPTTNGTLANGATSTRSFQRFSTAANGGVLGVRTASTFKTNQCRHNPTLYVDFMTDTNLANARIFVGLADLLQYGTDTGANNYVGFRYSTSAADGGWIGICNNGVLVNTQASAVIAPIAVSTRYQLKVVISGGGTLATFTVNNGTPVTMAVNLPVVATELFWQVTTTNLAVQTLAIRLGSLFVEWD